MKRRRSLPNLTEGQETALFALLTVATKAAVAQGLCYNNAKDKEAWRKLYLYEHAKIQSLKDIPRGGPEFCQVMAALQIISRDGINWIIRADNAKPHELLWHARHVLAEFGIQEPYACGVARNALRLQTTPALDDLSADQLDTLLRILRSQGKRIATAQRGHDADEVAEAEPAEADEPAEREETPF